MMTVRCACGNVAEWRSPRSKQEMCWVCYDQETAEWATYLKEREMASKYSPTCAKTSAKGMPKHGGKAK